MNRSTYRCQECTGTVRTVPIHTVHSSIVDPKLFSPVPDPTLETSPTIIIYKFWGLFKDFLSII